MAKSKTQRSYCNTCFCKLRRNMKVPASRYWRHWNISPLMETPNICPMLEVRGHHSFNAAFQMHQNYFLLCFSSRIQLFRAKWNEMIEVKRGLGTWMGNALFLEVAFVWVMLQFKVRLVCGRLIDSREIKTYFRLIWNMKIRWNVAIHRLSQR